MNSYILLVIFVLFGYLSGSIPFGYLVSRLKNIHIRKQGTGNIEATNTSGVLSFKYVVLAEALDIRNQDKDY